MANEGEQIEPNAAEALVVNEPITAEFIEARLGYHLVVTFPPFETDKACIIEFHEQLDYLEERFGAENIFGSLFYEGDKLQLGLFVDSSVIPQDPEV